MIKHVFKSADGQIAIAPLVGVGVTIIIAAFGSVVASARITDGKIDEIKKDNTAVVQRISVVETESKQYRSDISLINQKLDRLIELQK